MSVIKMAGLFLFLFLIDLLDNGVNGYELQRVVVLGRHSVRTPVNDCLGKLTSKPLPEWQEKVGYLTQKGALLEGYMGDYFSAWLKKEGLFSEDCPNEDLVYVHANATQRTLKTAESFVRSAFRNCNVTVHYHTGEEMDPLFNLMIRNSSGALSRVGAEEMHNKIDQSQLTQAYSALNRILDIKNSGFCKNKSICDLAAVKQRFFIKTSEFPDYYGPLQLGYMAAESFLMQYYNGVPLKSIGWGDIRPEDWKLIVKVYNMYTDVRFHCISLSKDISKPLLNYLINVLLHDERRFTLLVGHDANQHAIMAAMGFKEYELKNQQEKVPIGGKIVFQKWFDKELDRYLFKVNYVYQSTDQLRHGRQLSLEDAPGSTVLEIEGCEVDEDGYCLWDDFIKVVQTF